ncbi:MAG TPA: hypothetical protein VFH94_13320, partial [Streptomyces sp.]|nr:hypothetical protein [Streptomyces sp.]
EGDASDVAHRRDTVFHAVCDELTGRRLPGIQLHGFADSTEPDFDVILSTGAGDDGRQDARRLARELRDRDFDVCRAWVRKCVLEGRTNQQGRLASDEEVPFLHVEFSRTVRSDGERIERVVEAVRTVADGWNAAGSTGA